MLQSITVFVDRKWELIVGKMMDDRMVKKKIGCTGQCFYSSSAVSSFVIDRLCPVQHSF